MFIRPLPLPLALVAFACLLIGISTADPANATTETMGETSVLPNADGDNAGFVTVQKATLSESGTIESLSLYTPVAAGSVILGIYNASGTGGGPGTLLATTNSFTPVSGWSTANVTSPVTLAAGTYWLAYEPSSNTLSFTKNSIGNSEWMTYSSFGALPATFGTVAGSGTSIWSFYATLNVSSNVSSAVSGSCGSANSTSGSSAPTTNLCTAGTASSVSGTGPWTWSCAGSGGGSTASCSAPVTSISGTTTTINWGSTYQTISGWGASTGYNEINPNMTAAQADCFFSTSNGSCATGNSIGLGWIRIQDNSVANSTPDAATVLLAQARGAKVELGFNNPSSLQSNYAGIAAYDVAKIQYWQRQGVTINAISPVNEPQNTGTTAAAIDTFVASYLWPAMNAAGFGAIPLTLPESANWFATDYVTPCMNDSNCKSHVVAVSGHAYYYGGGVQAGSSGVDGFSTLGDYANCCVDYAANLPPSSAAGLPIWETEVNGGASGPCDGSLATYDSSMSPDALVWAHNIHDFLTVQNGTQWQYWNLESGYGCNDGLTDRSFNPAKRFYAIGNWSRFVQPGWVRIGATANPTSGVYVTAFKGGTTVGSFAIVVINENASSVTMNFSLDGFTSPSVTPYVTSAGSDLAEQSAISVTGDVITTTLGAESVTTFVGTGEE
jgi:O-glycosyl hydrolase